ncbi:SAM-dependent chlorinase/fluorinase [Synechococcus moorigangaii CMS01]|nr:SAM-dependent chlorinase/fluorinase [Synechococcus moorigangaii CMS01]
MIALMTDFGLRDSYVGVMKGVIAGISPQVAVIDLSHDIPPQDIWAGRFCLSSAAPYFPSGTIFVGVVDPGVGTTRQAIAVAFEGGYYFVGPNNGLGSGLFTQFPILRAVELNNPSYWRAEISTTFHGRDIFAPVAAHLAMGIAFKALGRPLATADIVDLKLPPCHHTGRTCTGIIQHIDHFGNLITTIPNSVCLDFQGSVELAGHHISLVRTYGDVPIHAPCALVGSHGWLEISINQGNAQVFFQVQRQAIATYYKQSS